MKNKKTLFILVYFLSLASCNKGNTASVPSIPNTTTSSVEKSFSNTKDSSIDYVQYDDCYLFYDYDDFHKFMTTSFIQNNSEQFFSLCPKNKGEELSSDSTIDISFTQVTEQGELINPKLYFGLNINCPDIQPKADMHGDGFNTDFTLVANFYATTTTDKNSLSFIFSEFEAGNNDRISGDRFHKVLDIYNPNQTRMAEVFYENNNPACTQDYLLSYVKQALTLETKR